MVLACAKDGDADLIVSGDSDILELKEWSGIKIMTSKELLNQLGK